MTSQIQLSFERLDGSGLPAPRQRETARHFFRLRLIALRSSRRIPAKARAYCQRARGRASPEGEILGTPRRGDYGPALPRSGQVGKGTRASRSGLPLVHETRDLKEAKALLDELRAS